MGHPKRSRPRFDAPKHPWKAARIEEEHDIRARHGLKTMREIWKARSKLRRYRQQAMKLIGRVDTNEPHWEREQSDLVTSLQRRGMLGEDAIIDDVLALGVEDILNRRLQARVYHKGLASSMKQARQLVTHGHIVIGEQKVTIPSYSVDRAEEDAITYHISSGLVSDIHPLRVMIEGRRSEASYEGDDVPENSVPAKDDAEEIKVAAAAAPSAKDTIPAGGDS